MTKADKTLLERIVGAEGECHPHGILCTDCPFFWLDCLDAKSVKVRAMEKLAQEELDKMLKGKG